MKERPVAKAGDVIENPITGEQITFLKTTQETNGELLRFEYVLPPGFTIPEHVHPHQEECHEVLSGTLRGRVGGQQRDYAEGERVVGPAGVPHAWQNPSSDKELRFISELRPPLVFETLLETYCGLARDGKTTKQGIPKNPLQLAVLVDETRARSTPIGYRSPCRKRSWRSSVCWRRSEGCSGIGPATRNTAAQRSRHRGRIDARRKSRKR